ncbi:MAG TPA: hypothetical protein VH597_02975 [Verrucomicrobiae bacterium]|jgi:hypothetical protein|nr:hypothetical protein [Verrucomicrobiae bacterium]
MSLVNDALKRAKDAQQKSPPVAPGPQLLPAGPASFNAPSRGMGKAAPAVLILIALIGLFLLWRDHGKTVAARPQVTKAVAPAVPIVEPRPSIQIAAVSTSNAIAKPPIATPPAPPAPALPKLQAIFFVPGHSSAIISGKTVRAGDTVQGFRVALINQASATLVSATKTNVMTLEQ